MLCTRCKKHQAALDRTKCDRCLAYLRQWSKKKYSEEHASVKVSKTSSDIKFVMKNKSTYVDFGEYLCIQTKDDKWRVWKYPNKTSDDGVTCNYRRVQEFRQLADELGLLVYYVNDTGR